MYAKPITLRRAYVEEHSEHSEFVLTFTLVGYPEGEANWYNFPESQGIATDPNIAILHSRIRSGSSDYVRVHVESKIGDVDPTWDDDGYFNVYPADNGHIVTYELAPDDCKGNTGCYVKIQLDWVPVNLAVANVAANVPQRLPAGSYDADFAELYAVDVNSEHIPGLPVSWTSSDPSVADIDLNGRITGHQPGFVTITGSAGGHSDGVSTEITNALDASISGVPAEVFPSQLCRFYADGGSASATPPYTYTWFINESQVGTGDIYDLQTGGAGAFYRVAMRITDASGREGWAYTDISTTNDGEVCGR
jgi:hypothetical protein